MGLRVRVLGGFEVEGVEARLLGSRKARTLAKVLVLNHDHAVGVDRLVDAVWGDDVPSRPSDQLSVLVSRVRGALGRDTIRFGDAGYRLDLEWLDRDELIVLTAEAVRAAGVDDHVAARIAASAALAVARGELLPEDSEAEWARTDRDTADRAVARARHVAAGAALRLGRAEDALDLAALALVADPYDEEALRHTMLACHGLGQTGAAFAAYGVMRRRLVEDMGVDPSRETEAVHLALLRDQDDERRAPDAPTTPLPEAGLTLAGRDEDLARLETDLRRVASGPSRLVLVEGEPGIGKTALLDALARHARSHGALVLSGACEQTFRALPLQSAVDALAGFVRTLDAAEANALLAGEQGVLGSMLGTVTLATTGPEPWLDAGTGQLHLFNAFATVIARLGRRQSVLLVIDDLHLAGDSTAELLSHLTRRAPHLLVVASRRRGEGPPVAADEVILLGPLDVDDAARIVGPERAADLHARTGGNPLFLTQLAASDGGTTMPASLVEAIASRTDALGDAGATLRATAVLGSLVDVELVAAVLRIAPIVAATHLERARDRGLLDDHAVGFVFCHALVREALADATPPARAALLHREAARWFASSGTADPLAVAHHARLGGDRTLAADAMADAAGQASARFDAVTANALLDQAIALSDTAGHRLARARARTAVGAHQDALDDVAVALRSGGGAEALEVGAWAAYFGRRFDLARDYADDGADLAGDSAVRASCLTVAGRVRHAAGDLAGAEPLLSEAAATAAGMARLVPRVWLGVLRSHQSRPQEALELLRPITRVETGSERTTELLHALMFTGHSLALLGRPVEALEAFGRYNVEVERRQARRFAGRGWNFTAWVLRALGAWAEADEANRRAVEEVGAIHFPETRIAAALDLADGALLRRDLDAAESALARAASDFGPILTFGWRLELRWRLDTARLALAAGDAETAADTATRIADEAAALGVVRYASVARLVAARAGASLGRAADHDAVERDLAGLDRAVGVDAWWVTAEVARDLGQDRWRDLAMARAAGVARAGGPRGESLATVLPYVLDGPPAGRG